MHPARKCPGREILEEPNLPHVPVELALLHTQLALPFFDPFLRGRAIYKSIDRLDHQAETV
jgi:hypothetical protein